MLLTIDFIHKRRIVHRDIKLDNILIDDIEEETNEFSVKIADFGLSRFLPPQDQKLFEKCGTPCYVAPEIMRDQGYGTKADMFSFGSLMFNLLTGRFLFKGADKYELLAANKTCDLSRVPEYLTEYSPTCIDLVMLLLSPNPRVRPSAHDALQHAWFKQDKEIL